MEPPTFDRPPPADPPWRNSLKLPLAPASPLDYVRASAAVGKIHFLKNPGIEEI